MKSILFILGFVFSSAAIAGGGSSVGPANPASVNCVKLGGLLETVETPAGQSANCVIGEWQLWRAMDARGLIKPHALRGNPASVNCAEIGGENRIVEEQRGQLGVCAVDEWALFRVINVVNE